MDPTQMMYEAGLRTQPAGIDSYRRIKQEETQLAIDHMPAFEGLFKVDWKSYDLNRLAEKTNGYIRSQLAKSK